ncbi:MAG: molybdopterin cofactor-binding domain-containing protein [Pseudomonadota bacterium]
MSTTRRDFLSSSFALGVWTLAGMPTPASAQAGPAPASAAPAPGFALWLRLSADGTVTVQSFVSEMGQGTHTSVAQFAAEELDMPLASIKVVPAPMEKAFINPMLGSYATFGSVGTKSSFRLLAPLFSGARTMLLQAAATAWEVAPQSCSTREAHVLHPDGVRRLAYTELLAAAAKLTPPADSRPRRRADWKIIGTSPPRLDIPSKVDGSAVYGIDVRRPGMLVATLMHAPRFGAELQSVDERPARAIRGVVKVVRLPGALAVVATSYWSALKGLRALKPRWSDGPHKNVNSEAIRTELLAAAQRGQGRNFVPDNTAVASALAGAVKTLDISYDVPFLAHATMEPMNAVAEVGPAGAALWLSTQSAQDTQRGVAAALGLAPEQVAIHSQLVGGGFGRRLEHGFAIEAALVAKAIGRPVQLIWSRETDLRAGGYRPAAAARIRIALGADGMPSALRADVANPSLFEYTGLTNGPKSEFDWSVTMGLNEHDYDMKAVQINWTRVDHGVPCGYFRGVGATQNCFFLECSVDRAAALTGIDPLEYRLRMLATKPLVKAMLSKLAERAGWHEPLPAGQFRGIAMNAGNDARSAHIVHISVPAPGRFRIEKIFAVIDVGVVFNPQGVEAQMMGGTVFGLSSALAGEITLRDGQVEQGNFDGYQLATLAQTPPIEVIILGSSTRPSGAGEEGPSSVAPALANALFAATGQAVTRLPLTRAGWQLAG